MGTGFDHVVLISLDTLRADAIAANPFKLWPHSFPELEAPRTEILDRLVRRGVFFPQAISSAPYTSASHASYFTGLFPLRHGVYEFFNRRLAARTVFSMARQQGMTTRFKVDFPIILGSHLGFDRDVDEYIVEDDDAVLTAIENSSGPSFNFVHFGSLHIPYGFHNLRYGAEAYRATVERLEAEIPPGDTGSIADQMVETYRSPEDMDLLLRYKRVVQHHYNSGAYAKLFQLYLEGVEHFLTTRFTAFFERLEHALAGTRSLIVLFGDHGEHYSPDSYGHFNSVEEHVLRVPVILIGEGIQPRICRQPIRTVDVTPTLIDLLGWPERFKHGMDGKSLQETVERGAEYERGTTIAQAYTVDAEEFVAFQNRVFAGVSEQPALSHVLYREAAYHGGYKLTRQAYDWSLGGKAGFAQIQPRLQLFRRDKRTLEYSPCSADEQGQLQRHLASMLDHYNKTRGHYGRELDGVPGGVRIALASMGYNI